MYSNRFVEVAASATDVAEIEHSNTVLEREHISTQLEHAKLNAVAEQKVRLAVPNQDPMSLTLAGIAALGHSNQNASAQQLAKELAVTVNSNGNIGASSRSSSTTPSKTAYQGPMQGVAPAATATNNPFNDKALEERRQKEADAAASANKITHGN